MRSLDDIREAPPAGQPLYQLDEDGRVPGNILLMHIDSRKYDSTYVANFLVVPFPSIIRLIQEFSRAKQQLQRNHR